MNLCQLLFSEGEIICVNPDLSAESEHYVLVESDDGHSDAALLRQLKESGGQPILQALNRRYDDRPLTNHQRIRGFLFFALINTGVTFSTDKLEKYMLSPVAGRSSRVRVGKPVGITFFAWTAVRLGLAQSSGELTGHHMIGVALLGGIGFTVALFITELAFHDDFLVEEVKVGILAASLFAGLIDYRVLRLGTQPHGHRATEHGGFDGPV